MNYKLLEVIRFFLLWMQHGNRDRARWREKSVGAQLSCHVLCTWTPGTSNFCFDAFKQNNG